MGKPKQPEIVCPTCNGKGVIIVRRKSKEGERDDIVTCNTCGGSGRVGR